MLQAGKRGSGVRIAAAVVQRRRRTRPLSLSSSFGGRRLLLAPTGGTNDKSTGARSVCVASELIFQKPRPQHQQQRLQQLQLRPQRQPLSSTAWMRQSPPEDSASVVTTPRGRAGGVSRENSSPYPVIYALLDTLTQTLIPPLPTSAPEEHLQQLQQHGEQHPWLFYFENLGQVDADSSSTSNASEDFLLFQKGSDQFSSYSSASGLAVVDSLSFQLQELHVRDAEGDVVKDNDVESYLETSTQGSRYREGSRGISSNSTSSKDGPAGASLDQLKRAVEWKDRQRAISEFNRLMKSNTAVPLDLVHSLFLLVSRHKSPPFFAFRLLRYYQQHHQQQQQQQQQQLQQREQLSTVDANANANSNANTDFFELDPVLDMYKSISFDLNPYADMYKSVCFNLRYLDPSKQSYTSIQQLVRTVVADVGGPHLSDENKCLVYPILISSLVQQRAARVGEFAGRVFAELQALTSSVTQQQQQQQPAKPLPPLGDGFLEHLLGQARYQRHKDMPYAQILATCAKTRRPYPPHAIQILEHMFPFPKDSLQDTTTALQALVDLQTQSLLMKTETAGNDAEESNNNNYSNNISRTGNTNEEQDHDNIIWMKEQEEQTNLKQNKDFQYIVDMSTLEAIGASAARHDNLDLSLLVWEAVQVMGYRAPSEAIYENLVLVFCSRPEHYDSAFAVLAEMEERCVPVSRALIRSISVRFRDSPRNLDVAMNHLKTLRLNGLTVTTAMLNTILSGGAERGDIERTLNLLEEFSRNNLEPNADSYSFALEALGKNLVRRTRNPASPALIAYCLETASALLTRMEEQNIAPTHHVIRDYVELLCAADQVETATDVVIESIQNDPSLVNNKTINRVAMANVGRRQFEIARQIAACATEPLPFLWRSIEKQELGAPFLKES